MSLGAETHNEPNAEHFLGKVQAQIVRTTQGWRSNAVLNAVYKRKKQRLSCNTQLLNCISHTTQFLNGM